ncbi:MAG: hypothetical protein JWN56_861 [Sphingobacteriales bacterium]|nr:hypothetical protein [Sphingobacteriales bacterium]
MHRSRINITLIVLLFLIIRCKKEVGDQINYKAPSNKYELAVEGGVNTFQKKQFIRLSIPALNKNDVPKPISNALVTINNYILSETDTAGVYAGDVLNNLNFNTPYVLKIVYNNKVYEASDTLKSASGPFQNDMPVSAIQQENNAVELTISKHTFGASKPERWFIAAPAAILWNPEKLNKKQDFSYSYTSGSPNSLYPLVNETRKLSAALTDTLTVYKFSITSAYSSYIYSVFQETDWKGIFSSSPGKITGNISGNAAGFFYAAGVQKQKIAVKDLIK